MKKPGSPNSADEFAAEILRDLTQPYVTSPQALYHQKMMREAQLRLGNAEVFEGAERSITRDGQQLQDLVTRLATALLDALPDNMRRVIETNVRFVCAETQETFGLIFQDRKTKFGVVVISSGLMILLSKLIKFDFASKDISQIIYCNRYKIEELTVKIIHELRREVIDGYREGSSQGPSIYLKGYSHVFPLVVQEAFVIAHEIAHYVDEFILGGAFSRQIRKENPRGVSERHAVELAADALGIYLLTNSQNFRKFMFSTEEEGTTKTEIDAAYRGVFCGMICQFFENLELAGHNESKSHPKPVFRIEHALWFAYGDAIVDAYHAWRELGRSYPDWTRLPVDNSMQMATREALAKFDRQI